MGVLPIAIGFSAGAEAYHPLALAMVSGMLFSTFLTLTLVPVVYTLPARFTSIAGYEEYNQEPVKFDAEYKELITEGHLG